MTLPATGSLSLSQIATELGLATTGLSLNHNWVRQLAQVPSGAIAFSNLRSKTGRFDGNLATQGTDAKVLSANFASQPWFGDTLFRLDQTQNSQSLLWTVQLEFIAQPIWSGKILVKNNTLGTSVVLSFTNPSWISAPISSSPNILRLGATDNFTILPSL